MCKKTDTGGQLVSAVEGDDNDISDIDTTSRQSLHCTTASSFNALRCDSQATGRAHTFFILLIFLTIDR